MFRWIIIFSLLFVFKTAEAHQPDLSSTLLVEKDENKWMLQIRAALTAFEYEVEKQFGESSYATPEEFKNLVLKHVQENLSILFNESSTISLQNGMVKLGHETSVTFDVVGTPETIQSLDIKNSSFSDISRNQNALIVLKKGFSKDQFILDNNNEHTAKLKVSNSQFELVTPIQQKTQSSFLIFGSILLLLSILYFFFRKWQFSRVNSSLQEA